MYVKLDEKERLVYEFLMARCKGAGSSVKAKHLAERFTMSLRDINHVIRNLRNKGVLIGSLKTPPFGYYIPVTAEEITTFMDVFKHEMFSMMRTFNIMQKSARELKLEGLQTKLWPDVSSFLDEHAKEPEQPSKPLKYTQSQLLED